MSGYYTLITGASQGLGKALAMELAQRGENLIMVSLPDSGQEVLSEFLHQNFNINTHHLELDLSKDKNYDIIIEYINKHNLQIKYLINNAGVLSRGKFEELKPKFILNQIAVNVTAPTMLTRLLLDNLKRNTPSGILNVSSMAGYFPLYQKQVYCGSKAYILGFSKSLRKELKREGVNVTTVCPGGLNTTTKLCYQNRILGWITRESVLTPEKAAYMAIEGMLHKDEVVIPGFINKFFLWIDKVLPQFIKDYITEKEIKKFPVFKK